MKNKIKVSSLLRKLRLLHPADILRFKLERAKNKQTNKEFLKPHPDVKLPPDYLIYESHNMSYSSYFYNGKKDAAYFKSIFEKYVPLKDAAILDWGCGPGRIIRHLPDVIGNCLLYTSPSPRDRSLPRMPSSA